MTYEARNSFLTVYVAIHHFINSVILPIVHLTSDNLEKADPCICTILCGRLMSVLVLKSDSSCCLEPYLTWAGVDQFFLYHPTTL